VQECEVNRPVFYCSLLFILNLQPIFLALPMPSKNQQATPAHDYVAPELIPYLHVRTVIDFTQRELVELMPELNKLEFVQGQDELNLILQRTGETTDDFFRDFPNTASLENVYQERVDPGGNSDPDIKRRFHYVISASSERDVFDLYEYRTNLKDERLTSEELKGSYLMTSGHTAQVLFFHPRQRPGCAFRYLGREKAGRRYHAVAFAQKVEVSRMTGSINLAGTEAVILKHGVAWIDPDSFQIVRMRTDLLTRRPDIGLDQHTTWIEFGETHFDQSPRTLWLPSEVRVLVRFNGWKFENRHRYSQYRLFTVESRDGQKQLIRP
jgi:hypothetical protein